MSLAIAFPLEDGALLVADGMRTTGVGENRTVVSKDVKKIKPYSDRASYSVIGNRAMSHVVEEELGAKAKLEEIEEIAHQIRDAMTVAAKKVISMAEPIHNFNCGLMMAGYDSSGPFVSRWDYRSKDPRQFRSADLEQYLIGRRGKVELDGLTEEMSGCFRDHFQIDATRVWEGAEAPTDSWVRNIIAGAVNLIGAQAEQDGQDGWVSRYGGTCRYAVMRQGHEAVHGLTDDLIGRD